MAGLLDGYGAPPQQGGQVGGSIDMIGPSPMPQQQGLVGNPAELANQLYAMQMQIARLMQMIQQLTDKRLNLGMTFTRDDSGRIGGANIFDRG